MNDVFTLISSYDGLPLSVIAVRPPGQAKAVVQFAHGMCGCKERFLPVMEWLAGKGYVCVANDHRGHGGSIRSSDDLGYMYDGGWKALVSDLRQVTAWAADEFPGLPVVLAGHSMGSLAARTYVKYHDEGLAGLVLCGSPSFSHAAVLGRIMTGAVCAFGLGRIRLSFIQDMTSRRYNRRFVKEGYQAWTCSDPEVRRVFAANPLCNFSFTVNASYNLLCMMEKAYSRRGWKLDKPEMPVLFLSGEDDPCMKSRKHLDKAAAFMKHTGYADVRVMTYPDMRHEVLNEMNKEEVWHDLLCFIESCL